MLHHLKTLLIVITALVGFATAAHAQELTSPWEGRHFLLAFPDTTTNLRDPINPPPALDTIALVMYSPKGTHVAITGPGGYQRSVTLPAGEPTEVYLDDKENPATRIINDISGVVTRDVFSVEADDPITLYCWMMTPFGGEAWTPLPVERWGQEYQVISAAPRVVYDGVPAGPNGSWGLVTWKPHSAPVYFIMIAANDNTEIDITTPNRPPLGSQTVKVNLDAGESYQLQWSETGSYQEPGSSRFFYLFEEPSGSMIRSNKPIGLVGGASRACEVVNSQPHWANYWYNSAIEWLLPVALLDTDGVLPVLYSRGYEGSRSTNMGGFITNPSKESIAVDIHYGDARDTAIVISPGEIFKMFYEQSVSIAANSPIQLMGYKMGDYTGTEYSYSWGSSAMICPPRSQWYNSTNIFLPFTADSVNNFVEIVTEKSSTIQMYNVSGKSLPLVWSSIPETNWKLANIQIDRGQMYRVRSSMDDRFIAYGYGAKWGRTSVTIFQTSIDTIRGRHYDELSQSYALPFSGYVDRRQSLIDDDEFRIPQPLFNVFPNPAQDFIRFDVPGVGSSNIAVDIVNCLGQNVMHRSYDGTINHIQLDIRDLVSGVYTVRMKSDSDLCIAKFMKL